VFSFVVSLGLSFKGYKKKSLSLSGAIGAFVVCGITMGASYRFGITMLNFYITSSALTKM